MFGYEIALRFAHGTRKIHKAYSSQLLEPKEVMSRLIKKINDKDVIAIYVLDSFKMEYNLDDEFVELEIDGE